MGSGLQAWYDFNDYSNITSSSNIVSQLNDKSSNGLHLTVPPDDDGPSINTKTINGINATYFNGNELHNVLTSDIDHSPSDPLYITTVFQLQSTAYQFFFALSETTVNPRLALRLASTALQLLGCSNLTGLTTYTVGDEILFLTIKLAENQSQFFVNGSMVDNAFTASRDPITHIHIGTNEQNSAHANAIYGDFVIYRGNDLDREKVEGYTAHKWGIENLLPSDHTYKNNPPIGQ